MGDRIWAHSSPVLAEWTECVPAAPVQVLPHNASRHAAAPVRCIREVAGLAGAPREHQRVMPDVVFLSHVLVVQEALRGTAQHFNISTVLVEDTAGHQHGSRSRGFLYRTHAARGW